MRQARKFSAADVPALRRPLFQPLAATASPALGPPLPPATCAAQGDASVAPGWSEADIVLLHWRLLQEVRHLADPATPLDEKFDTLRWIFTEHEKDLRPFSFVNCLRVVGCSPLSPIAYCGMVDVQEVRDTLARQVRGWLCATLERYPTWVRDTVLRNPAWVAARLAKNPQWINAQLRQMARHDDLFV